MSPLIDFQDGGHGGHLGFPIGTILAIFALQDIPMLPAKFQVNWPFSSGEEAKIFMYSSRKGVRRQLFFISTLNHGYSTEAPYRSISNEYAQHIFMERSENYQC